MKAPLRVPTRTRTPLIPFLLRAAGAARRRAARPLAVSVASVRGDPRASRDAQRKALTLMACSCRVNPGESRGAKKLGENPLLSRRDVRNSTHQRSTYVAVARRPQEQGDTCA